MIRGKFRTRPGTGLIIKYFLQNAILVNNAVIQCFYSIYSNESIRNQKGRTPGIKELNNLDISTIPGKYRSNTDRGHKAQTVTD